MAKKFSVEWLSRSFHEHNGCAPDGGAENEAPASPTNSCGFTDADSDDSEAESGPNRRVRTKFTCEQISRLEKTFSKHRYLGASQRRKIADKLRLSETQVKTWFQNRRMKLKREAQDMRTAEFIVPAVLPPMTSFQHHKVSGQRTPLYYHPPPPPLPALQRIPAQQQQHVIHPMMFAPCYF